MKSVMAVDIIVLTVFAVLPASACRGPMMETSILFDAAPPVPASGFGAFVEITGARDGYLTARIVEMLNTDKAPRQLLLEYSIVSSCDRKPDIGAFGYVVGKVTLRTDDALVVLPERARSQRLRDIEAPRLAK